MLTDSIAASMLLEIRLRTERDREEANCIGCCGR